MRNEPQDRERPNPGGRESLPGEGRDDRTPEYGGPAADPRYAHLGSRDWRGQWAAAGDDRIGQNSDVPGYEWQDSGAAMTTGRDFDPERPQDEQPRASAGPSNQTSEPGPSRGSDVRQQPEQTSGLDRPPSYREKDRPPTDRPPTDRPPEVGPRGEQPTDRPLTDRPPTDPGARELPPQPFGDHRYGQPDEWSSHHDDWSNRPARFEDVNSGFAPGEREGEGAGMGAGMYWSGESAREDDAMRGRMPDGRQIPSRGRLAERGPYAGRGPRGYQRSDERIAEDVSDRLTDDEYLDASDISVTIQDGVVVLEGSVDSDDSRRRAQEIADSCSGVSDVKNQLEVRSARDAGVTERMSKPAG